MYITEHDDEKFVSVRSDKTAASQWSTKQNKRQTITTVQWAGNRKVMAEESNVDFI